MRITTLFTGAVPAFAAIAGWADVKPNGLFTDNMVLQRDIPVKVFGPADDGESVTVTLNGQTATTTAKDGQWPVTLKPMKAGGPYRLTVKGKHTSDKPEGFEVSADGVDHAPAEATIQGDQVVVWSDAVKHPKQVRYAWTGFPKANPFNKEGLPAHPFRTDRHVRKIPVEPKPKKNAKRKQ